MWPTNPSTDQPDHPPPYNWYLMRFFRRFSNISSLCIDHYYYYHFWRCYNHCGWLPPKAVFGLLKRARDYGDDDDGDVVCSLSNNFLFQIFFHGLLQSEYRVHFHFLSYWSFYFSPLLSSAWDALIVRPQVSQSVWLVGGLLQTYKQTSLL